MLTRFKQSFAKDLRRIGEQSALRRIRDAIEQVEQAASLAEVPQLKKLSGGGPYYRLRIGDYRVGLVVEGDVVTLVRVLHRRDIYRFFP